MLKGLDALYLLAFVVLFVMQAVGLGVSLRTRAELQAAVTEARSTFEVADARLLVRLSHMDDDRDALWINLATLRDELRALRPLTYGAMKAREPQPAAPAKKP